METELKMGDQVIVKPEVRFGREGETFLFWCYGSIKEDKEKGLEYCTVVYKYEVSRSGIYSNFSKPIALYIKTSDIEEKELSELGEKFNERYRKSSISTIVQLLGLPDISQRAMDLKRLDNFLSSQGARPNTYNLLSGEVKPYDEYKQELNTWLRTEKSTGFQNASIEEIIQEATRRLVLSS